MNTEQFNSTQFNGIAGLILILDFILKVSGSITKIVKKIKAFGVFIAIAINIVKIKVLEFIIKITNALIKTPIIIKDFSAKISPSKILSVFKSEIFNIVIVLGINLNRILNFSILITINLIFTFRKTIELVIKIVNSISRAIVKVIYNTIKIEAEIIFNFIFELGMHISLGIVRAIAAIKSFTIKIIQAKSIVVSRIFEFVTKISPLLILGRILNFVVKISMSFTTNAKFIYLYWKKQLNPDIIGFKILQSNSPYGTFAQIATTTNLHYVKIFFKGAKWLKVIPYTSRGDLKYILFKGVKYG